jgi:diguanylate cyclase (GGDEF)-like protein
MFRLSCSLRSWPLWIGLASCVFAPIGRTTIAEPGRFLNRIESLRTADHPRFVQMLAQVHDEAPQLSVGERWHLRYLDAWETMYEGGYAKSEAQLREIIDHSGDSVLAAKSSALLLSNLGLSRRYAEAFELANHLTATLPEVKDPQARFALLTNLSQMLDFADQIDLAIQYAHMAGDVVPPGESLCRPLSMEVAALYNGKRLASDSPVLQRAIAVCTTAQQPVITNTMWLVLGSIYLDEKQPSKTLALLSRITPDIRASGYQAHMLQSQVELAQAYEQLGKDDMAKQAALAAVGMSHPGDISDWLMVAYQLLYRIEKKQGDIAAALANYERYVIQNQGHLDDVNARTLAYQTVQQHLLAQKLQTETLSQQNAMLRMRQTLDAKTAETNRLYLALLLMALASAVFWMFRLKRSQLRFKKLSHLDGLTTVFNRQHFMGEVERTLHLLERRAGTACLVFIDLDHFKRINDTHGHAMGDEVLRQVVAAGKQQLRPADLFGRLGGEEFGILLVGCSHEQGAVIADRIRLAVETTTVECEGAIIAISTSVGLACTDTCSHDLQRLCREADAALYRAKRGGRNRVVTDAEGSIPVEA